MKQNLILAGLVLVLGVAIVGGYYFPKVQLSVGSPAGTTFNTAKIAAVSYTPSTSAASSTSILNTDTSTRIITGGFSSCNGTNGQGFTLTVATTSVASQGLQGNANYAENIVATTTTTSTNFYVGSTTEGVITNTSRLWPSGTYLSFVASAVNAGTCTVGVNYLGS